MISMSSEPASVEKTCAVLAQHHVPLLTVMDVQRKLASGQLSALLSSSPEGDAAVIFSDRDGWRQVELARGPASALLQGLEQLRERSTALLWEEGDVPAEGATLDARGFRQLLRQVFTQDLSRVPMQHPEPPDLEVRVMTTGDRSAARELFARTHAHSVEGMYTTWPKPPTVERCAAEFDTYLSGAQGEVVATACVVVCAGERLVGVICCAATDTEGTAALLGLAVDPEVRGKGLSRILVRRAQRALKEAGFARMLFLTTDRNAPVHRLFTPEEIVSTETFPIRLWLRDAPAPRS